MIKQPCRHPQRTATGHLMQQSPAVRRTQVHQIRVLVEDGDHGVLAATLARALEPARRISWTTLSSCSSLSASRVDRIDDLVVTAIACDDEGTRRITIGPDAAIRVDSAFEQQLRHVEIALQDGHVQRPHFAAAQIDNLRSTDEKVARRLDVATFDGLVQFRRCNLITAAFSFGQLSNPAEGVLAKRE